MPHSGGQLKREIGLFHAVLLGLGSILGTGVFVSIGIAAGVAGPAVLVAIVLAALLALCNGLSSAQLAAAHPVAGGTYEYGYRYLNDKLGFTAGWMFLCAKSASAATAAIGVAYYVVWDFLFNQAVVDALGEIAFADLDLAIALISCTVVMGAVLGGIRRSAWLNTVLVLVTVSGLVSTIGFVLWHSQMNASTFTSIPHQIARPDKLTGLLSATALMFVAYTGYGRIATLGEEVRDPKRVIPTAILVTLGISAILYLGVGYIATITVERKEPAGIAGDALAHIAWSFGAPSWLRQLIAFAAITAMLGVLLNLILGLSRVVLAMGRRGDMPRVFAKVNAGGTTPMPAVLLVSGIIMGLTLVGDVKATWSFAAFTVLIYYGLTNIACLRLPKQDRLYPRAYAWAGLGGCFFLAWWVEPIYWIVGCMMIVAGLFWQAFARWKFAKAPSASEVCFQCGYDLRASTDTCPECGTPIPDSTTTET